MKAVRIVSAAVVFFLLFGLPAMMFVQFTRLQQASAGTPGAAGSQAAWPRLLGKILSRIAGSPSRPGAAPTGVPGYSPAGESGADGRTGTAPANAPEESAGAAAAEGGFGDEGRPVVSGRSDNAGMEELEGGPIDEARKTAAGTGGGTFKPSAGPGGDFGGLAGSKGPQGRDKTSRSFRSQSGRSQDDERAGSGRQERADTAKVELNTDQLTGDNEASLIKTSMESNQASNMSKKLHLLDGAKDHAGRQFDGNTKFRKSIPLDKYTDSFGNQAIRAKEQPSVDLSP